MGKRLTEEQRKARQEAREKERRARKIKTNLERVKLALEYYRTIKECKLHISTGNKKIGHIPNVSTVPIFTCPHCEGCKGDCYACKSLMRENVRTAWADNTYYAKHDPAGYFDEISRRAKLWRWFRWHVAGDIINAEYFAGMVRVAVDNPKCDFLAFTKAFEIVNAYVDAGGVIPSNLHMIFSNFESFKCDNPHEFPTTDVINHADELPDGAKLCGGNCETCICRGVGCWELKKGERLYFVKH